MQYKHENFIQKFNYHTLALIVYPLNYGFNMIIFK